MSLNLGMAPYGVRLHRVLVYLVLATSLVVAGLGVHACFSQGPGLSPGERSAIDAWLVCRECVDSELDNVLALGTSNRPGAVAALGGDLLTGPSTARRNHIRQQLIAMHGTITSWATSHGVALPMTEGDYVNMNLANFIASYKIRAAFALGKLGGADTRPALDSAAAIPVGVNGFRTDVHRTVVFVRDSVWTP